MTKSKEKIRCAECDCETGGSDCNWIKPGPPATCEIELTAALDNGDKMFVNFSDLPAGTAMRAINLIATAREEEERARQMRAFDAAKADLMKSVKMANVRADPDMEQLSKAEGQGDATEEKKTAV